MNQKKMYFQGNIAHACVHNDIYLTIPQQKQLAKRATLTTKEKKNGSQYLPVLLDFYWLLLLILCISIGWLPGWRNGSVSAFLRQYRVYTRAGFMLYNPERFLLVIYELAL